MTNIVKKKGKKGLTPKQRLFGAALIADPQMNGTKAYMAVYKVASNVAAVNANKLLKKANVADYLSNIRGALDKEEEKALLTAQQVEEYLDRLITQNPQDYYEEDGATFKNIHDLTPEQAYALNEISHIETPVGSHVKIKYESKRAAIDLKMKRLGLLKGDDSGGDTNIQVNIITFNSKDLCGNKPAK